MITQDAQVLLSKPYAEISYDAANKIIIAQWKGFLTLDQVKEGCKAMDEVIEKNKITKHLSDHSQLKVLSKDVQAFITGEWFARVDGLGIRKIAIKVAENVFAQATVQSTLKDKNTEQKVGNMTVETFGSYQAAYEWLEN